MAEHKVTLVHIPSHWKCKSCGAVSKGKGAIAWALCGYCPYCKSKDIVVVKEV